MTELNFEKLDYWEIEKNPELLIDNYEDIDNLDGLIVYDDLMQLNIN